MNFRLLALAPIAFAVSGCLEVPTELSSASFSDARSALALRDQFVAKLAEEASRVSDPQIAAELNSLPVAAARYQQIAAQQTTPASALSGTAQYSGRAYGAFGEGDLSSSIDSLSLENHSAFTGNLALTANFDKGALSGAITDMRYSDNLAEERRSPAAGSLALNGQIQGGAFRADLNGSINNVATTGTVLGNFKGELGQDLIGLGLLQSGQNDKGLLLLSGSRD